MDGNGRIRAVDQKYINETDLMKGGKLQAQGADAFGNMAGLMAIAFIGGFIGGFIGSLAGSASDSGGKAQPQRNNPMDDASAFLMGDDARQPEPVVDGGGRRHAEQLRTRGAARAAPPQLGHAPSDATRLECLRCKLS